MIHTLTMGGQLILAILIIVGIHELGHLLAARAFGMRVERYFIGFPPKIFSFKHGNTEYGLGCIPLGGFVKIAGMMDESMDTQSLKKPPQPWEFRSKPAWQRLIVMLGGILFNGVTGVLVFFVMLYANGEDYIPKQAISTHGIVAHPLAERIGLRTGDKILAVNGKSYQRFSELVEPPVFLNEQSTYTVERDGEHKQFALPEDFMDKLSSARKRGEPFISPRTTFSVGAVVPEGAAATAGLRAGDVFLSINEEPITYFDEFKTVVSDHAGQVVRTKIRRGADTLLLQVPVSKEKVMGFYAKTDLVPAHQDYSLGTSLKKGSQEAVNVVWTNIRGLSKVITGKVSAANSLMGPIGIAKLFGSTWNWHHFWRLVGMISMILAFMNLLPIPALDGGHVVLCLYEMVTWHPPSKKFVQRAQGVGMVLLLLLMAFAIFNDIINL